MTMLCGLQDVGEPFLYDQSVFAAMFTLLLRPSTSAHSHPPHRCICAHARRVGDVGSAPRLAQCGGLARFQSRYQLI